MSVLPDGDWPPSIGRRYTRLALVENPRELLPDAEFTSTMERDYLHGKIDKIVGRKKEIQVPEIFTESPGETQLKILMDGAPGVGKTTLSRKIAGDWASGVLLEQFHLVILLHLRDPKVCKARCIKDLFPSDGPQFQQDVIQHIQDTAGEHVLFIFDAYDELSYEERTCNSLFLDIIEGRSLHNCSVLVTSRPYASDHLQQLNCINRHVEVLGFTKEQIESCIRLAIPDEEKATSLVNLLQERMDIISLCYTPLNCAIMLYVYKQEQYTLPDTLTGLYEAFILNSLKKHARNLSTFEQRLLNSATSLRGIPKSVKKQLDILSKLASEGLSEDKMIFSYMDVISAFSDYVDSNVEDHFLGLMTGSSRKIYTDYQFIHLSVQEFLAARWVATQLSNDELVVYFHGHMNKDRFRFMLIFLAGISKLNFQHANQILSGPIDLRCSGNLVPHIKVHFFFFILQLIFETKNLSLYQALKTAVTDHAISVCWYKLTAFDCVLLAHFLHWSNCSWKVLNFYGCGLTDQSLEILHKVSLSQPASTTCIEEVDLSYCSFSTLPQITWFENTKMTIEGIHIPLLHDIIHSIGCVKHLNSLCITTKEVFSLDEQRTLSLGLVEDKSLRAFERMLTVNTVIRTLKLQNCKIGDDRAKMIGAGLAENKSLRVLDISGNFIPSNIGSNDIHSDGAVSIFTSLEHNTSLEELDLSRNRRLTQSDSGAVGWALEKMLVVNSGIQTLTLNSCGVSDNIGKNIGVGLAKNKSLRVLDVSWNGIHSDGAVSIFTSLEHNTSLEELHLSKSRELTQSDSGAVGWALEKMLVVNSGIQTLTLNSCGVSDNIGKNIGVGLAKNKSLRVLDISWNGIHSDGAVSIFTSLEHNTSLEELDLSGNRQLTQSDSEAVGWALEIMMTGNCKLKVLHLGSCDLTPAVLYHLATGLTHATGITELDISDNEVLDRSDSWKQLFRAFHQNTSVKKLDINGNTLGLAETEALAEMLACNKSLTELNVSGCCWSGAYKAELKVLARGLVNNTTL